MSIVAGIAATKQGTDVLKSVMDYLKGDQVDKTEVGNRLLALHALILESREALGEAQEENRQLKAQLDDGKRLEEMGREFISEHGVYWWHGFPYCPVCWDIDRKPVRLGGPVQAGGLNHWTCHFHNKMPFAISWSIKVPGSKV